ncbi:uncharacterized protein LOC121856318 [Homarus americanus]|uniref:uncharacterized protein LOC121856318 n=1 Tax=Homarus americanus TaxID=6706 RepID=UPI001C493130|nr:uncharacterized protein LOC121856318 [Homarus americanus]
MVLTKLALLITVVTRVTSLPPLTLPSPSPELPDERPVAPTELLKAFGMSEPGVRRWYTEPPQYMLDLYNQVADSSGLTRLPGPYGATIVRAFSEKEGSRDSTFSFSVNGLGEEEQVLQVELHVYHSRLPKTQRHLLEDNIYMLEVEWVSEGGRQVLVKQHVAAHSSGWRVFKVGGGVVGASVTLQVTATTSTGRSLPLRLHHGAHGTRQPLLVLFNSHAATVNNTVTPSPVPQQVESTKKTTTLRYRSPLTVKEMAKEYIHMI